MSYDLSFWHLFIQASFVVKLVMGILLVLSIFSWAVIWQKAKFLRNAQEQLADFEKLFWSGIDLGSLYSNLTVGDKRLGGLESVFVNGFKSFVRGHKQAGMSGQEIIGASARSMRVHMAKEVTLLETKLPFLASVQSTTPYIGLFGTVWGIMHAFRQLGAVQHATLSMVAPGISEALVATAMGLIAAIPAGIAYNKFISQVDTLAQEYENFIDEFTSLLQRRLYDKKLEVKQEEKTMAESA